jgi:hypothetical protein
MASFLIRVCRNIIFISRENTLYLYFYITTFVFFLEGRIYIFLLASSRVICPKDTIATIFYSLHTFTHLAENGQDGNKTNASVYLEDLKNSAKGKVDVVVNKCRAQFSRIASHSSFSIRL